jgi:hypothetical protein
MKKLLALGTAAAFAVLSLTMTAVPASAGGISFGFGGFDSDWDDDYDSGIVLEFDTDDIYVPDVEYEVEDDADDRHVDWCEAQYQTYDEDTDMYYYAPGKQRQCISPWS